MPLQWPLQPETRLADARGRRHRSLRGLGFEHPDRWMDRTFEMAGDELSMTQLAEAFSRMVGHEVTLRSGSLGRLRASASIRRIPKCSSGSIGWGGSHRYQSRAAGASDSSHVRVRPQTTWRAQVPAEPVGQSAVKPPWPAAQFSRHGDMFDHVFKASSAHGGFIGVAGVARVRNLQ